MVCVAYKIYWHPPPNFIFIHRYPSISRYPDGKCVRDRVNTTVDENNNHAHLVPTTSKPIKVISFPYFSLRNRLPSIFPQFFPPSELNFAKFLSPTSLFRARVPFTLFRYFKLSFRSLEFPQYVAEFLFTVASYVKKSPTFDLEITQFSKNQSTQTAKKFNISNWKKKSYEKSRQISRTKFSSNPEKNSRDP